MGRGTRAVERMEIMSFCREWAGTFRVHLELNKNFLMWTMMIVQGSRKLKESEKEMRPDLCLPDLYL